jgi:hypothetical protein
MSLTRLGLPAACAGLLAACGLAVVVVGRRAPPPAAARSQQAGEGDLDYVRRHRWWLVPVTSARVEEFVGTLCGANTEDVVWFDPSGETVHRARAGTGAKTTGRNDPRDPLRVRPESLSDRAFPVFIDGNRRWTRGQALAALVRELNAAEFRGS